MIDSGQPQTVTYNLAEDDELWGMGVGCDGLMRVYLQAIIQDRGNEQFAEIAEVMRGGAAREIRLPLPGEEPEEPVEPAE